MVGIVTAIKYSDHDVVVVTKFPDLASQVYLEIRGACSSGMPLI
jgi:gamma-glutamylcysteine synthetase